MTINIPDKAKPYSACSATLA